MAGQPQTLDNFQIDRSKKSGFKSACKTCCRRADRARRKRKKREARFDNPGFLRYISRSHPRLMNPMRGREYADFVLHRRKYTDLTMYPLDKVKV